MRVGRDFNELSLGLRKLKIPREYHNERFTRLWRCTSGTQGKGQSKVRVMTRRLPRDTSWNEKNSRRRE